MRGQRCYKSVKAPARQSLNPFITWTDFTDTQQGKRTDNICCCLFFFVFDPETVMMLQKWLQCLLLCKTKLGVQISWFFMQLLPPANLASPRLGSCVNRVSPHGVIFLLKQLWDSALCCLEQFFFFFSLKSIKQSLNQDPIKPNIIPSSHSEKLGPISGHLKLVWMCQPNASLFAGTSGNVFCSCQKTGDGDVLCLLILTGNNEHWC